MYAEVASYMEIDRGFVLKDGRKIFVKNGEKRDLPRMAFEYKELLEFCGISYNEVEVKDYFLKPKIELEIFDPNTFQKKEINAPLFIYENDVYKYKCVNTKYRGETYTMETIDAAYTIFYQLKSRINEFDRLKSYQFLLGDKKAIILLNRNIGTGEEILLNHVYATYQVLFKDDKRNLIGISTKPYATIIMDMDSVGEEVTITVPNIIPIGKLIGVRGWQLKRMKQTFNKVKKINFVMED